MNPRSGKPTQEEVLDEFAVEPLHDRVTLERYLREYPEYGAELVDLSREVSRYIASDESPLLASEEKIIEEAWQNYASIETDSLSNLSVEQSRYIAQKLGVPRQVITALKERRVKIDTISDSFLSSFSEALHVTLGALTNSLSISSSSRMARSYKADEKPVAAAEISFEQLLTDAGVSSERRAELMAESE